MSFGVTQAEGVTAVPGQSGGPTTNPVTPAQGGTGLTSLTAHSVLLGEGTASVGHAGPVAAGSMLVSTGTTTDPAFGNSIASLNIAAGTVATPSVTLGTDTTTGLYQAAANTWSFGVSGANLLTLAANSVNLTANAVFGWNNDSLLVRDSGGNAIGMHNGTSSQQFSVYNTFSSNSNYERGEFSWQTTANVLTIGTQAVGAGVARSLTLVSASSTMTLQTAANGAVTPQPGLNMSLGISSRPWSNTYTQGLSLASRNTTTATTLALNDYQLRCDATAAPFTVTLPTPLTGQEYRIVKINLSINAVTIMPSGTNTINGAASLVLNLVTRQAVDIIFDPTSGDWTLGSTTF